MKDPNYVKDQLDKDLEDYQSQRDKEDAAAAAAAAAAASSSSA